MIAIGGTTITKAYLGQTELANIAIGDELLFSEESILPEGYVELKYITNNSSAYIDTGLKTSLLRRIETSLLVPNSSATKIFGSGGSTSGILYSIRFTAKNVLGYTTKASFRITSNYDGTTWYNIVFDMKNLICTFNGAEFQMTAPSGGSTYKEYLFAYSQLGNVNHSYDIKGSMARTRYYEDDILVRDYIPCISPDNIVGMYDLVNDDFNGHSDFIAGRRK